jgi:TPR repeat protein
MIKILRTAAFLLCTAVSAPVMAQDLDKGLAAYNAGDYETALQEWLPLAADQGVADAQFNLGFMYANGRGVIQDYAEAAGWFRLAADQGVADAQYNLGFLYNTGRGVIQDYAEAVNWYRLAADQGDADAQYNLGFLYDNGRGVIQDAVLAHMWYNIGGANGNELGSDNRGLIEEKMTREQIAEAQALARRCMASDYQDCG